MKKLLRQPAYSLVMALCLAACGGGGNPEKGPTAPADTVAHATAFKGPGYYSGTLPCADCPGRDVELWVRGDGTYVMRMAYQGKDGAPFGEFGTWKAMGADGLSLDGERPEAPQRWKVVGKGLQQVDDDGAVVTNGTLERLADAVNDEVPTMRVMGVYRWAENEQSFRPCGSKVAWPAGMGLGVAEEEGDALEPAPDLVQAYRKAGKRPGEDWAIEVECHLGMGPAMEGDAAEEYLYVHRLIGPLDTGYCP